jgi:hypothetical protein
MPVQHRSQQTHSRSMRIPTTSGFLIRPRLRFLFSISLLPHCGIVSDDLFFAADAHTPDATYMLRRICSTYLEHLRTWDHHLAGERFLLSTNPTASPRRRRRRRRRRVARTAPASCAGGMRMRMRTAPTSHSLVLEKNAQRSGVTSCSGIICDSDPAQRFTFLQRTASQTKLRFPVIHPPAGPQSSFCTFGSGVVMRGPKLSPLMMVSVLAWARELF